MNTNRQVTERDFRMPQFRDADLNDYEFREDGKIVRKDRWEMGMHRIAQIAFPGAREFEIDDVVKEVREVFSRGRRDAQEIVDQTNQIAALIAADHGFELEHQAYHKATATRAIAIWKLACRIQELMTATDPENAVAELEEEGDA
ncbi:hypothetical protein [Chromobacterium haemolyticum]|uniref:hypothetical protein n=1 Tax=Chromobacterium haemolyticum TaxID=394935 RepID=UPI00307DD721